MATIVCKILNTKVDDKGVATITVEFDDNIGKWQKIYTFNQTEPIDFARFKERLIADLRGDLKVKAQLTNIATQVGRQFTITI